MAIQNGLGRCQNFFRNQDCVNMLGCSVTFYEYKNVFLMLVDNVCTIQDLFVTKPLHYAPQFRRHATGTYGLAEKYNMVLIACGTPAARRWLPQALALPTFFAKFLSDEKSLRCVASIRNDGNHARAGFIFSHTRTL